MEQEKMRNSRNAKFTFFKTSYFLHFLLALLVTNYSSANQKSYNDGIEFAKQNKQAAIELLKNFDSQNIPGFTENPDASKYYGGVTQKSDKLAETTRRVSIKSEARATIEESFSKRPMYKLDKTEPGMQKSQHIIDNAQDIARGISNKNVDCTNSKEIVCGGKFFCINGDCSKHEYEPSKDFEKSISALSAMGAAQKEFDGNYIFRGERLTCDAKIFGYSNCCQDTGWGQDLHLASCSDEEKKLGLAKQKRQTIYLGEYCSKRFLGVCLRYDKAYCSFSSKLSRIIQEQGRKKQLKISFGSAEHSNCRGITPEEMQLIDFSKINFGEFYSDLHDQMKMPNVAETQKRLAEKIKQQYQK